MATEAIAATEEAMYFPLVGVVPPSPPEGFGSVGSVGSGSGSVGGT